MIKLKIERLKKKMGIIEVSKHMHQSIMKTVIDEKLFEKVPEQRLTKYGIIYRHDYNHFL
jgi:hypothetical protein